MSDSRQKILGVDFDGTLFLHSFPDDYSEPNWQVINYVKARKLDGWYVILVTCRTKQELIDGALQACHDVGLEFDAVNENHPALIAEYGDCRKVFCDEYIDDKNITLQQIEPEQTEMKLDSPPRRPVVYISGKMRGLPGLGKERFDAAERMLKELGFIVINPAILPAGLDENDYLPICMAMLDASDCIFMLDGWKQSKGAVAEYSYAICQDKGIIFEPIERAEHGAEKDQTDNN